METSGARCHHPRAPASLRASARGPPSETPPASTRTSARGSATRSGRLPLAPCSGACRARRAGLLHTPADRRRSQSSKRSPFVSVACRTAARKLATWSSYMNRRLGLSGLLAKGSLTHPFIVVYANSDRPLGLRGRRPPPRPRAAGPPVVAAEWRGGRAAPVAVRLTATLRSVVRPAHAAS